jgi:DnaJ-class molecular chaperone
MTARTCPECDGEGTIEIDCPTCDGKGEIEEEPAQPQLPGVDWAEYERPRH